MCGGNCNIERVKICSPSLECLDYVPRIQSAAENGTMSGLKHEICTISESGQGTVSKDVFFVKFLLNSYLCFSEFLTAYSENPYCHIIIMMNTK
jgi:hypothetical protein